MQKENNKNKINLEQNKLELDWMMTENYYPVNITMVKYLGIEAALFFSALYEEMDFMKADLSNYNTFSIRTAREKTGLPPAKQKKAIAILQLHKLIETRIIHGFPSSRKIRFKLETIKEFKDELANFRRKKHHETGEAKREFKEKIKKSKQDYCEKKYKEILKEMNDEWYNMFPELNELTDNPISYVFEHTEWITKRIQLEGAVSTNLLAQQQLAGSDFKF